MALVSPYPARDSRQLAYDLANGVLARRRARRELLERNTPEAWKVLLSDPRFCKMLVEPKLQKRLLRICELTIEGHAEAKTFLNWAIPTLTSEYLEDLHRRGHLDPLLKILDVKTVISLGDRNDLKFDDDHLEDSLDIVFGRLAELAAEPNTGARECLERRVLDLDRALLDRLVRFAVFQKILDILSPQALINLGERNLNFNYTDLECTADLVVLKVLELAERGDKGAIECLERQVKLRMWGKEYLDHLAKFGRLKRILDILSPQALFCLIEREGTDFYDIALEGARDLVVLKMLELAERGNKEVTEYLSGIGWGRGKEDWNKKYRMYKDFLAKREIRE